MEFNNIKMGLITGLCVLASSMPRSYASELAPYAETDFSIPDNYKSLIKRYPRGWKRLTGYEFSGLHWKQFVLVFMNDNKSVYRSNHLEFLRVFEEDLDPEEDEVNYQKYPVGTIVLKEGFSNSDGKPGESLLLSGMIKHEAGYDPEYGDWEYFQSDKSGKILTSGNSTDAKTLELCIGCHKNIESRDYIFATQYSLTQ